MSKIWNQEEIDFLLNNYKLNGADYCAKALNRSRQGVFMKASRLKLKSETVPHRQRTHQDYENQLFEQEIDVWPIEKYIGIQTPILHECLLGHQWKVQPNSILQGHGCPKCSKRGFDQTSPAIVYYIKISKDNETYYKVGVTNKTVKQRFKDEQDKTIEVIKTWNFDVGLQAKEFEKEILKQYSEHRQNITKFLHSGNTELFEFDILNLDETK